jgi:hypothetical protein
MFFSLNAFMALLLWRVWTIAGEADSACWRWCALQQKIQRVAYMAVSGEAFDVGRSLAAGKVAILPVSRRSSPRPRSPAPR